MKKYNKKDFPVEKVRKFLEPGPVVLVSSHWKGQSNIMTMGWHTVMEFTPSLIGCIIAESNFSHQLIRKSRECVINIPTADLLDIVTGIGNCSGATINKFEHFGLSMEKAEKVKAPAIRECYASFECHIADTKLVKRYNFFIFEVLKAHVAASPKLPKTVHYRGEGKFMISGKEVSLARSFKPGML